MSASIQLSASIIAADLCAIGDAIDAACAAGVDGIHVDIMDHHFVPNLSIGPMVCSSMAKREIAVPVDAHLMVTDPDAYIEPLANAKVSCVTFHPSTSPDVLATLANIRSHGMKAGLAFNPDEDPSIDVNWLPHLDMVLMMSVFPGFCGQTFMPEVKDRLAAVKAWLKEQDHEHVTLAVDGGINADTLPIAYAGGARFFVVGSALYGADHLAQRVNALRGSVNG